MSLLTDSAHELAEGSPDRAGTPDPASAGTAPAGPPTAAPAPAPAAPAATAPTATAQDEVAPAVPAATDPARRTSRALGPGMRTALLTVLVLLIGVAVVRPGGSGATRDFSLTANSVNSMLLSSDGVTTSTGGYLPGTGIVLVTSLTGVETGDLKSILSAAMTPFADQLADLPEAEALSWQTTLTGGTAGSSSWLIRVPGSDLDSPATWVFVPNAGGGSAAGSAAAATAATTAATTTAGVSAPTATADSAPPSAADTSATAPTTTGGAAASETATTAAGATGPTGPQSDDFSGDASLWSPSTGTWKIADGTYRQTDASGYDYIASFGSALPATYTLSVTMTGLEGTVNGGLILGQPKIGARAGATIVDLASTDYIRWGVYDASTSTYKFLGGASLGSQVDPAQPHTLSVQVKADTTVVTWDGTRIGSFSAVKAGYAGLVTSQSAVAFDNFTVVAS